MLKKQVELPNHLCVSHLQHWFLSFSVNHDAVCP